MEKKNVLIMGAAGRDFHNFNVFYRDNEEYNVVAFTATQIPNINDRLYPAELAGKLYPKGIMIYDESELENLIKKFNVQEVVFAYSDVPFNYVMTKASIVNAAGVSFRLLGAEETMVKSTKPVISIIAVRTGSGKSQTSRKIVTMLREAGKKVVAIRHPMPYGDLVKQKVQRFGSIEDLKFHKCTIEEIEEYEPHIVSGGVIYSGVDYEAIVRQAEQEADIIIWDGGNNDFPFYHSDLTFTVVDPLRAGNEMNYYPGNTSLRLADIVVINKIDSAEPKNIKLVRDNIRAVNPKAIVIEGASPITVEKPELITGKRVLVVEDGPTLTHGEMEYGAGVVAAWKYGAKEIVDPRPYTVNSISETYKKYPKIGTLLPAMGYSDEQIKDLEGTINATDCDSVIIGTPIDLGRLLKINKPSTRVQYDLQEIGDITIEKILKQKGYL
ncbi:MAG: GTPase [Ignavibacteria bacterium CG_4_8_14_3_um_filter_37_9]|nr:GTPase [Ignavibacteria bacterium]OIO18280.1 MAG: GTPase [Ignavibacteria bacterium CG1_02_37_35]PIP78039.1 MAG: GTPase [Ignavibacteria bacterium CG22_combo_CG10-13_8_21_14_all_37_15]PIS43908.1 MAG: GTPase [Ignavibacteria bacterium CG08_land_8_20_14_0_20_37_9]PIW99973.1 MAG: GTPase [Ignavibacteria bacterium CG_4_8_14_3_um_filter_37_9]PIX92962.1 MAG: GTPase [Ignavibacteria bacterium CG_4_10_14_3_um_filter_37_18]PJC60429.1 MAG: GTPase [Ignavibacteria bacterium CG_4_9_14_0_2_um_filter_37_13]